MSDSFDMPETDEVLQSDEEPMTSVPVNIEGIVRTDEMPSRLGMVSNVLLPIGSTPVKVLPANPRRKKVTLWVYYAGSAPADTLIGAMLGQDVSDISGFTGPVLFSMNAITRYEFGFQSELWAKGVNVENDAESISGIVDSTNDVLLHILTEDWAR